MSPKHDETTRFRRDFGRLTAEQRVRFRVAIAHFVEDLRAGDSLRPRLRVREIQGSPGIYELTWDRRPDGRATFEYRSAARGNEAHVVWRRVGGHAIYREP